MGCLHIFLGDRFNKDLQDIYTKAMKYLLSNIGQLFDDVPTNYQANDKVKSKFTVPPSKEVKVKYSKCLRYPGADSKPEANEPDSDELLQKMNDLSEQFWALSSK